jgi:hypothetical protein
MEELVRKHLARGGLRVRARRRVLADRDFHFRGGFHHPAGAHMRLTDAQSEAKPSPHEAQEKS